MVTVSCLIVLATLFSQINSDIPASASPKAVDIFFFYYICRMFLVCLRHTFLYAMEFRKQERSAEKKRSKSSTVRPFFENTETDQGLKKSLKTKKHVKQSDVRPWEIFVIFFDFTMHAAYALYIQQGRFNVLRSFYFKGYANKQ